MQWKMGKRMITVTRLSEAHAATNASSIFESKVTIEEISAQRMRKIAKREPVYVAMIRTNEDSEEPTNEEQVVTVNKDKTKTEYPEQVQELLN